MRMLSRVILTAAAALFLGACASTSHIPAVTNFDAAKYAGVWYEIARLPHSFEKNQTNGTAIYKLDQDGELDVANYGLDVKEMRWENIKAHAWPAGDKNTGELRMMVYWPFRSSYRVIELGKDYDYAVVAGGSMSTLWILSRKPAMDKALLDSLLAKAAAWGFDKDKMIIVDQSVNIQAKR